MFKSERVARAIRLQSTERNGDPSEVAGIGGSFAHGLQFGPPEVELNGTFLGQLGEIDPSARRRFQAAVAVELSPEKLELILDASSSLLPFHFLRTGDRLGRAVVKLLRSDGAAGTGFMVAPGILLTNHHVLPDIEAAASAIALANYEAAPPGTTPGRPASVPLDPDELFVSNAELDFTFCAVRGLDFLGTIALDRNSLNIRELETVNIIQHPRGRPKEVALRDNRVVKADSVIVHYACSTEPGSSGSPVFNNQWEPVAVHHASVRDESPEARAIEDPFDESTVRYLNEGIRISAIAIWLETVEANSPALREQTAKLRAIFSGIDPQVGFFGALGRKAHGRSAPEVVVDSYREGTEDLDLSFWNVRGLEWNSRERLADVGQVVADMGMDLWCLSHVEVAYVAALREHLDSHFNLDYEFFHEPAGDHSSLALLYRRSKSLAVERRSWDVEMTDGVTLPPLITIRAATRRSGTVVFQLVPVGRPLSTDAAAPPFAEAVRQAIRQGHGEIDWIVVGDGPILLAPEKMQVLADCNHDLLTAAAERDGAVALLTSQGSKVAQVFLSPNLRPVFGEPGVLCVTKDRELPPLLRSLGGHQPIAFRLSLDGNHRPSPALPVTVPIISIAPLPPPLPPASLPSDDELERRIRDMLAPVLAKLLSEVRPKPDAGG